MAARLPRSFDPCGRTAVMVGPKIGDRGEERQDDPWRGLIWPNLILVMTEPHRAPTRRGGGVVAIGPCAIRAARRPQAAKAKNVAAVETAPEGA